MAEFRLTSRFLDALEFATILHQGQYRKGTSIPYIAHLLAVTSIVLEDGGDEDTAIAALLHDAVEDQGGRNTLGAIKSRFGDRVAQIVDSCTDTYETPKPPWRERKESYLHQLRTVSPEAKRVSLADKVHNARAIVADLHQGGKDVWERFNGGKGGTLWYYQSLVEIFQEIEVSPLVRELRELVEEMKASGGE